MKNLRLVLPLILLILLVLVFTGCKGIVPSPGATEDLTISGKIKMPFACCTIEEPIFEEDTGHYTDAWSIIPDAVVELRDAQKCDKLLASTFSDENGEYTFDNVEPGLYIITTYCPVQKKYILKDVVEKKAVTGADAGIPDCDSTALALIIEILNDCFGNYNCFKKNSTIYRLARDIGENIGEVDLPLIEAHDDFGNLDDEDYNDLVDLVCDQLQGCCIGPGFTPGPGPGPTPNPCAGNEAPSITVPPDVTVSPNPPSPYSWTVTASDSDGILGTLEFSLDSVSPTPTSAFSIDASSGVVSWDPDCADIDGRVDTTYTITVSVSDGCDTDTASFKVTLDAEDCICESAKLSYFSLEINEGSNWNEYLATFDPDINEYTVSSKKNASHFRFTVNAECPNDVTLQYNWYRGDQCGGTWLTGESGYTGNPPTAWRTINSGGTYPTDTNDRPVCQHGGNALFVKVTNGTEVVIYKVNVNRSN